MVDVAEQLPTFIKALRSSDAGEIVKLAFEFMILSAARTSEVLNATWSEIDRKANTWTVQAERMKAGITQTPGGHAYAG